MKMTDSKIKNLSAKKFLQGRSGGKEAITRLKYTGSDGNRSSLSIGSTSKVNKLKAKSV